MRLFSSACAVCVVSLLFTNPVSSFAADEPAGKVTGKVFVNWMYDLTDDTLITKRSAMDLTRAYLGYKYTVNENFSTDLTLDVERVNGLTSVAVDTSRPPKVTAKTDTRYEVFLKTAYLECKGMIPKTSLQFGVIPLILFGVQEKFWGYRYIAKSLMDEKGYSSSADLGLTAKVKPIDMLQISLNVTQGEGYKKPQDANGIYKTALGIEANPIKGLTIYAVGDAMPVVTRGSDSAMTISAAGFVGYEQKDKFKLGAEYDLQMNQAGIDTLQVSGISVYGTYVIVKGLEALARVDMTSSLNEWNKAKDGKSVIVGLQYSPVKNVKVAVDYQGFMPDVETVVRADKIFFNLEFGY